MSKMRFHVGEYIRDEINARAWSLETLALKMGGGDATVNLCSLEFLMCAAFTPDSNVGQIRLGRETAEGLSRAFGSSVELWMRLDAAYHGDAALKIEVGQ